MNYRLAQQGGKVRYIVKQDGGNVGSDTSIEAAEWILGRGKPFKAEDFEGFPVAVKVGDNEYHFAGEWLMGGAEDVLAEEPKQKKPRKKTNS